MKGIFRATCYNSIQIEKVLLFLAAVLLKANKLFKKTDEIQVYHRSSTTTLLLDHPLKDATCNLNGFPHSSHCGANRTPAAATPFWVRPPFIIPCVNIYN